MHLGAKQLQAGLARSPLAPVYLISGDEPLQIMECADSIRRQAREQGYTERVVYDATTVFDWNSLLEAGSNLSLFAERRLLEVRLGNAKPGREGSAVLQQYCDEFTADNLLLLTSDRIDKQSRKSKWYKTVDKTGVTVQVWPISAAELPGWIQQRFKREGKSVSDAAAELLADRVEGNMLAANQEIRKLCLLITANTIDVDAVAAAVADSTRFDVFDMIATTLAGNASRAIRMLNGLRAEGADPAAIFGALMWEYRRLNQLAWAAERGTSLNTLFKEYRIWDNNRKQAIKTALNKHSREYLNQLLRTAIHIDRKIKSADRELAWDQLQLFLLSLSGKSNLPLSLTAA